MNRKQEYKKYLGSKEWAQIKNDIYELRGRKCERCGSPKCLEVHHKTYERIFNEEPADLELLCKLCHLAEHNRSRHTNHLTKKIRNRKKNH